MSFSQDKLHHLPRLMIAGIGGDSGKTLVTIGLIDVWRREGYEIVPFKKGPDYIDAAWLTKAASVPAHNLDSWMMGYEEVVSSFTKFGISDGINVIEGNRGLHDGEDSAGSHSSGVMAKLLSCPVVPVIPVTKVTRTVAAFVLGVKMLDPDVQISGVILNRIGTNRQEKVIRRAVEDETGIPVLGAVYKSKADVLPGRHLGLVTPEEHQQAEQAIAIAGQMIRESVDWKRLAQVGQEAESPPLIPPCSAGGEIKGGLLPNGFGLRIGYFTGSAFTFYYPENLDALKAAGVNLIKVDPIRDSKLPQLDVLYIGGGFPETHAFDLAGNESFRQSLRDAAGRGLPIWAECGGLMFLSKQLLYQGKNYPMAGVLPISVMLHKRPQGHGYQQVVVDRENPFLPVGTAIKGHEFHYSQLNNPVEQTIFTVHRGTGVGSSRDGVLYKNVLASYLHVHATATPEWCEGVISAGHRYKSNSNFV